MSIKRRLFAAMGANATNLGITAVIQLLSVPVLLHFWGAEQYGKWIILSAIPAYFSLSDVGFMSTTINRMTISAATQNVDELNRIFQTTIVVWLFALFFAVFFSGGIAYFLNTDPLNSGAGKLSLVILAGTAVIAMAAGLVDAVFRSKGEFALGTQLGNTARVTEWIGLLIGVAVGRTFFTAAVGQFIGRSVGSFLCWAIATRRHPDIQWNIKKASYEEFKRMIKPSISFMAFPVSNALSIQGMTLVVGHSFGPAFLAVFNTFRTLSRLVVQIVTLVSRSLWPEISRQFGLNNFGTVKDLYKKGTLASVLVACLVSAVLAIFGEQLVKLWTLGRIAFDQKLFFLFLLVTVMTSTWQMGMVVFAATNTHSKFARYYLFAAGLPMVACLGLSPYLGAYSSVTGLLMFEFYLFILTRRFIRSYWRPNL